MENPTSCSSSSCQVLAGQKDNPENMNIYQHVEENEGEIENENEAHSLGKLNPLEMLDIVNLLLKKLDGKTLKSSLMVSKLWNEEGMKLFIKNHCIRVPPKLALNTKQGKRIAIKEFKKLFSKFNLIPNVAINKSRDIQILKDFEILEQVKYVKMNKTTEDYAVKIMDECPNLSFLEADNNPYTFSALVRKCVETGKDRSFTISHLWSILANPGVMEQLANSGVRVVHLRLEIFTSDPILLLRISNSLEKLLHSIKDCLETLKLQMERNTLSSIKNIPVMPQLKQLSIQLEPLSPFPAPELSTIFPSAFKFSKNCPNLKTCSFKVLVSSGCGVSVDGENFLDRVFATTGPAQSVKSLTFSSHEPHKLDKLFQIFNGIESLSMGSYLTGTNLSPVWELGQNLKSLKLELYLDNDIYCQLLAQVTGYPLDFITGLCNSSADLKNLDLPPRARSSILNLQDLEGFTIDGRGDNDRLSKWNKLVYELALRHMPKMKKRQETA